MAQIIINFLLVVPPSPTTSSPINLGHNVVLFGCQISRELHAPSIHGQLSPGPAVAETSPKYTKLKLV